MDASTEAILYDTSPIGSSLVRTAVDSALQSLSLTRREGAWDVRQPHRGGFPRQRTVVISDLHRLGHADWLDYWSAGPSTMSYVFLVRTALDRRRLCDPEVALRLNDEKFFLLDIGTESARVEQMTQAYQRYFRAFVERLEPDRVRSARFAPSDDLLWVEFADGLERGITWSELPFARKVRIKPVTASAADHGQSVLFLDAEGQEIDVDAGALRAAIDARHASKVEADDRSEREATGLRIRRLRQSLALSQEDLAARSGIAQESLSRLETGKRDPRLETLRKLADGLGLELSEMLARLGSD